MSDEIPPAAPLAKPAEKAPEKTTENDRGPKAPIAIIRDQATTSSWLEKSLAQGAHTRKLAQAEADADAARIEQAKHTPGEAGISKTADLGRPTTNPVVVLELELAGGRKVQYVQCDLTIAETAGKPVLQLNMICPRCVASGRVKHQADAQIRISEKNKRMSLDMSTKGEIWVDPDDNTPYLLAGTIEVDETCMCPMPGCGFKFKIGKSPTRGLSRLYKE